MRSLKNVLLFLAGGAAFAWIFGRGIVLNTDHPREGCVVYEDDEIKVTRMTAGEPKDINLATITYKHN